MGESCIRGNIMPGDGVYKSTDAGKTWTHVGFTQRRRDLEDSHPPHQPRHRLRRGFGLYYGPSDERGVFKSTDGGKTWKRTLFKDREDRRRRHRDRRQQSQRDLCGAVGGVSHRVPDVERRSRQRPLQVHRRRRDLDRDHAQPRHAVGRGRPHRRRRHQADSNRVYALVENENGGLFVSDDAGASWKLINANRAIRQRAFYYTHVFGDPSNKDVVYMQNTALFRSTDGGKTTAQVGQNTHGDHHDLWVDPDDPNHVVDGNDGGGAITYDINSRVPNWSEQDFPTAQWYHVITTAHLPFHVCGSQQDNSTLCVPSNTNARGGGFGGNPPVAPYQVGGGEPGYIAPHRDRSGRLLRRHQQRLVPDAPQPPHRRVQGSRRLSALLLRRAVEGRQGTLAVDLPDHLFLRRSERALHELAARLEDDQRRRHVGGDQRRPDAVTIRRRCRTRAVRSRTT